MSVINILFILPQTLFVIVHCRTVVVRIVTDGFIVEFRTVKTAPNSAKYPCLSRVLCSIPGVYVLSSRSHAAV